jgi:hypothetical protein
MVEVTHRKVSAFEMSVYAEEAGVQELNASTGDTMMPLGVPNAAARWEVGLWAMKAPTVKGSDSRDCTVRYRIQNSVLRDMRKLDVQVLGGEV